MPKKKIDLKKIFIPSDAVPIVVILIGLFIAIFLTELAIRLIGISVAILGSVALFMLISQRISEIVEMKYTPGEPTKNFKVTQKKSASATSTVFEDFTDSFGPDPDAIVVEKVIQKVDFMGTDEGFRVVNKVDNSEIKFLTKEPSENFSSKGNDRNYEFADEFSEVKVNGSKKSEVSELPVIENRRKDGKDVINDNKDIYNVSGIPDEIADEQIQEDYLPTTDIENNIEIESQETLFKAPESDKGPMLEISFVTSKKPEERKPAIENRKIENEKRDDIPEIPQVKEQKISTAEDIRQVIIESEKSEQKKYKETVFDSQISILTDDLPILGSEPRKEFEYFLNRALMTIRSVTNTRTASFNLLNSDKQELIMISHVTDVPDAVIPRAKFSVGNDVVSQILINKKPEILTEINPVAELDLIPYYKKQVGTSSFIGVPVFYNNSAIGVLCADTNVLDAYDALTVTFFGHFTKLISALVQSYTDKYDMLQASRTLESINQFRNLMSNADITINDIVESLIESSSSLFEFCTTGICGYDEANGGWYVKQKKNKIDKTANITLDSPMMLESSLIGESIINNKTLLIAPLDNDIVRIYPREQKIEDGFFVAIPIQLKSISSTYGALYLEGKNTGALTSYDINILETLCDHAGSSIEKLHFIDILQTSSMFDTATGMLNPPAFYHRFDEEFNRSSDFKFPLTLCVFQIDKYASFHPEKFQERMEKVMYHVLNIIRKYIRSYDVFGRIDTNTFGVLLIGMKIDNARVWAERLRKEIAISVLEIESKRFTVTISAGLACSEGVDKIETLFENAKKVLAKSLEKTNAVTLFT